MSMFNRRNFLSRTGLLAAAATAAGAPHIARSADAFNTRTGQAPRRIIHVVSDGMSPGTLSISDQYSRVVRQRPLAWMKLFQQAGAHSGLMNMRSLNSLVTDSSAASSSWGCGSRILNGAINVLPDGQRLTPLYSLFAEAGWTRALVTTTEITHATPAGFATNVMSRDNPQLIAAQYLERKVDILLGGGKQFFDGKKRRDKRDLKAAYKEAGYSVVETLEALNAAPKTGRLLGIFTDSHLPYTVDHQVDEKLRAKVPTIGRMVDAALQRLAASENFILQIEGGRVDHAAHGSDAAAMVLDQLALDEAIEQVLEFQRKNPDTLVILTTDHGNSNPGLNGMGGGYTRSTLRLGNIQKFRASTGSILGQIKAKGKQMPVTPTGVWEPDEKVFYELPKVVHFYEDEEAENKLIKAEEDKRKAKEAGQRKKKSVERGTWVAEKDIIEVVEKNTGYRMPKARATMFQKFLLRRGEALFDPLNNDSAQLGQLLANYTGVNFIGTSHTSDYVQVIAIGPGSERFGGLIQNTDVFTHYTELAGIKFKNRTMPILSDADAAANFPQTEDIASYCEPFADPVVV